MSILELKFSLDKNIKQ